MADQDGFDGPPIYVWLLTIVFMGLIGVAILFVFGGIAGILKLLA